MTARLERPAKVLVWLVAIAGILAGLAVLTLVEPEVLALARLEVLTLGEQELPVEQKMLTLAE